MAFIVTENAFTTKEQAIEEIEAANLWVFEAELEAGEVAPHWHNFYAQTYVLEGQLNITDVAAEITYECGPGARIIGPPRTVHSEQCGGVKIVAGLAVDPSTLDEDINLDPAELRQRS